MPTVLNATPAPAPKPIARLAAFLAAIAPRRTRRKPRHVRLG